MRFAFELALELGYANPMTMLAEMPAWMVGAWRAFFKVRNWEQAEKSQGAAGGKQVRHRARRS